MKKVIHVFDRIDRIAFFVAQFAIFIMMIVIVIEALTRYFFNSAISGAHTFVESYLMVILTFLGMSYVMKMGGHIRLDLFIKHLPNKIVYLFDILYMVIAAGVMFVIGYQSAIVTVDNFINGYTSAGVVPWPIWTQWVWVPIGAFIFTLRLLLIALKDLLNFNSNYSES